MSNASSPKRECILDRNDVYPWPLMFLDEVITHEISSIAEGRHVDMTVEEFVDGHLYHYADKQEINELSKTVFRRLETDPVFFERTMKEVYRLSEKLNLFTKERIPADPDALSNEELVELVKAYVCVLRELRVWGWVPALIDGLEEPFLTQACLASLRDDVSGQEEEVNRLYSLFTMPVSPSEVQKSEIAKYQLMMEGADELGAFVNAQDPEVGLKALSKPFQEKVRTYLQVYAWTSFNYTGPAFSVGMLQTALRSLTPDQAKHELAQIKFRQEVTKREQEDAKKRYTFSPRTQYLLTIAASFLTLKEYRKSVYQSSYVAMEPILAAIAKRLGCSMKEVKFLCVDEFAAALVDPKTWLPRLQSRAHYAVVLVRNGTSTCFEGEAARAMADHHRTKKVVNKGVKELTGQVAFPGNVRGVARIVLTVKDMTKMQPGDILVSAATNPDLLPAMKQAAAIVTDTGGIISHAAIISREFHIPCVVGTKIATKTISDGDNLHVDAQKGLVHIL